MIVDDDCNEDTDSAIESDDEIGSEISGDSSSLCSNSLHAGLTGPAGTCPGSTCFFAFLFLITKKMTPPTTKSSSTIPRTIATIVNVDNCPLPASSLSCEGSLVEGSAPPPVGI